LGLRQQRADANYFTVDGVSANFGVTGYLPLVQTAGGALPALSASGGTNSLVAVEKLCPPQFTHVPFRVVQSAYKLETPNVVTSCLQPPPIPTH
jgi:hypothetical protein